LHQPKKAMLIGRIRRYCPVRAWIRLRFLEGARDRRWLWSETSTHFHW